MKSLQVLSTVLSVRLVGCHNLLWRRLTFKDYTITIDKHDFLFNSQELRASKFVEGKIEHDTKSDSGVLKTK